MFLVVNVKRIGRACLRKFVVTCAILLTLYLAYIWLAQPEPKPQAHPAVAMSELYDFPS